MSDSLAVHPRGRGAHVRFYDLTGVHQVKASDKLPYFDYVPSKTKMVFSRGLISHDYLPLMDDTEAYSATEDIYVSGLKDYRKHFSNKVISRQHAILRWKPTQHCPVLTDIGSTHGTFVHKLGKNVPLTLLPRIIKTMKEPMKLKKDEPVDLEDGDVVFLGKSIVSGSETFRPTILFIQVVPEEKEQPPSALARPKATPVIDLASGDEDDPETHEVFGVEFAYQHLKEEAPHLGPDVAVASSASEDDSEDDEDDEDDDDMLLTSGGDPDLTLNGAGLLQEDGDSAIEDSECESEAQGCSESEEGSDPGEYSESEGLSSETGEEAHESGPSHEQEKEDKVSGPAGLPDLIDHLVVALEGSNQAVGTDTDGEFAAAVDLLEPLEPDVAYVDEESEREDYGVSDLSQQYEIKDDHTSEVSTAPTSDSEESSIKMQATKLLSASKASAEVVVPLVDSPSIAQIAGKKRSHDELVEEDAGATTPEAEPGQLTEPTAGSPVGYKKFKTFTAGVAAGFAAGVIGTFVGLSSLALNDSSFV